MVALMRGVGRLLGGLDAGRVQPRTIATVLGKTPPQAPSPRRLAQRGLMTPDRQAQGDTAANERPRAASEIRGKYMSVAAAHGGPGAFPAVRAFEDAPDDVKLFSEVSTPEIVRSICHASLPGWSTMDPGAIKVDQLCEGLSNQNFRVHLGADPPRGLTPCALFRIYGKDVDTLYDGEQELRIVEMLSRYGVAPKVLASGEGWRIEEWHFSVPLPNRSMRNPSIFLQVAAQLGRLHKLSSRDDFPEDIAASKPLSLERLDRWGEGCAQAAASFTHPDSIKQVGKLGLDDLLAEREWLRRFVLADDPRVKGSGLDVVFSHNDSQENNILQTQYGLRLIDFEYAGMEHQAYDIANYFIECTIDYLVDQYPFYRVRMSDYPTEVEQQLFCSIYLSEYFETAVGVDDPAVKELVQRVERFALMSHLLWSMWSVIRAPQAPTVNSFNYLTYAESRWFMYKWAKRALLHNSQQLA